MKYYLTFAALIIVLLLMFFSLPNSEPRQKAEAKEERILQDTLNIDEYSFQKTNAEWREILTSKQYRILRKGGTEFPFTNELNNNKREGIYFCAGCGQKLYSSEHKYDSGSGWPSFWKPITDSLVGEKEDNSYFMSRTEIVCSNCGGHLGHVFDDGPQPTGLRYCMNSAAMDFVETKNLEKREGN